MNRQNAEKRTTIISVVHGKLPPGRKEIRNIMYVFTLVLAVANVTLGADPGKRVKQVADTEGLIAFWDFSLTEDGKWTSYVDQILELIEQAAANSPSVTFLRLSDEVACTDDVLLQSHVGGVPYAESGDEWPQGTPEGDPAKFMLQVRLDHPGLGDQWQGRLVVAFLVFDYEQAVRSYAAPSLEKYVALDAKRPPNPCILLKPVRLPAEVGEEGSVPMIPAQLCDDFPEITVPLEPYTKDFDGVLAQILRPNVYGYNLDAPDISYIGADPMLIQNPHDPTCDECGKQMRFLFQFGEIVPGVQMADAGVFYVYGCDEHPNRCKGFVDSH